MGFFRIIFDIKVYNMYWSIKVSTSRQEVYQLAYPSNGYKGNEPSQTESKHLSSHVITTSARIAFCSCHFSGARLTFRLRSNIGNNPLRVYLSFSDSVPILVMMAVGHTSLDLESRDLCISYRKVSRICIHSVYLLQYREVGPLNLYQLK